jgi:hypothetical protein
LRIITYTFGETESNNLYGHGKTDKITIEAAEILLKQTRNRTGVKFKIDKYSSRNENDSVLGYCGA